MMYAVHIDVNQVTTANDRKNKTAPLTIWGRSTSFFCRRCLSMAGPALYHIRFSLAAQYLIHGLDDVP
jgi:hypothetical protein